LGKQRPQFYIRPPPIGKGNGFLCPLLSKNDSTDLKNQNIKKDGQNKYNIHHIKHYDI
jgi:hypothetical protein